MDRDLQKNQTAFEHFFSFMINKWIFPGYLLLIIFSFEYWDKSVAYYFHEHITYSFVNKLGYLTQLGSWTLYIPSLLLLALFFRCIYRKHEWELSCWFMWLSVFIPGIICLVLKNIFGRARPTLLFNEQSYGFFGFKMDATHWSFPSGHTTTITGFILGLGILFPRYFYVFLIIGLSIISSRVLLTQHYLSDVLATFYLTLIEIGLLHMLCKRKGWFNLSQDSMNQRQ